MPISRRTLEKKLLENNLPNHELIKLGKKKCFGCNEIKLLIDDAQLRAGSSRCKVCVVNKVEFRKRKECKFCCRNVLMRARQIYCSVECGIKARNKRHNLPNPLIKESNCKSCGKIVTMRPRQLFCSSSCCYSYHKKNKCKNENSNKSKIRLLTLVCKKCGKQFVSKTGKLLYCSDQCRLGRDRHTVPKEYYVYGWYKNSNSNLPFYIGKGIGYRAWEKHDGIPEHFRTSEMIVKIYRDRLTNEGALLCESLLYDVFTSIGACLMNGSNLMKRQEIPPLET